MSDKKKLLGLNLKKAQGMLSKITKMVDEDVYCVDIAQQINATIGLLQSMNTTLFQNHLRCCGVKKLTSKESGEIEKFIEECTRVWSMTTRK